MSNDEDDEFYDRTERVQSKKQRASIEVHDAASLFGKRVSVYCAHVYLEPCIYS